MEELKPNKYNESRSIKILATSLSMTYLFKSEGVYRSINPCFANQEIMVNHGDEIFGQLHVYNN